MDTSKDYYKSVMRDFKTYDRGRTLWQYCRDEAVDYKLIENAKEMYEVPAKGKGVKPERKAKSKSTDIIRLHFEPEPESPSGARPPWRRRTMGMRRSRPTFGV